MKAAINYRNYLEEIDKAITNETHQCLYLGCHEQAIGSHSVQRKGPLSKIEVKDHVYCLDSSLSRSYDLKSVTSNIKFRKTPISKATTFPGFCDFHDKLFHEFELGGLDVGNAKHLLYLYYRTLGYELLRQVMSSKRLSILLGSQYLVHSIESAFGHAKLISETTFKQALSLKANYCENELMPLLEITQEYIKKGKVDSLEHLTFVVEKNLNVACSSCTYITEEHFSEFREVFPNEEVPTVTFNVMPDDNETIIVISWDSKYDIHSSWLRKEFKSNFEKLLNDFIFYRSEDICISPKLWENNARMQDVVKETGHILNRKHEKTLDLLKI